MTKKEITEFDKQISELKSIISDLRRGNENLTTIKRGLWRKILILEKDREILIEKCRKYEFQIADHPLQKQIADYWKRQTRKLENMNLTERIIFVFFPKALTNEIKKRKQPEVLPTSKSKK